MGDHSLYMFYCFQFKDFFVFFVLFFLLVIRGVPSLIFAQTQVSAPLNSQPVNGYRKGRALLYLYGVQLMISLVYSWDMLHVGLEHVGSLHAILHTL